MKKILILTLALTLLLTGCTENSSDTPSTDTPTQQTTTTDDINGINITLENITAKGLTMVFTQKGGKYEGDFETGEYYKIEIKDGEGNWVEPETKANTAWNDIAYIIKRNDTTKFDINWEWLYGELSPGEYRIYKQVLQEINPGEYNKSDYYRYFEIK